MVAVFQVESIVILSILKMREEEEEVKVVAWEWVTVEVAEVGDSFNNQL